MNNSDRFMAVAPGWPLHVQPLAKAIALRVDEPEPAALLPDRERNEAVPVGARHDI